MALEGKGNLLTPLKMALVFAGEPLKKAWRLGTIG